ncbi:hypothetical protein B0T22DRAFT_523080 [Podospora appendiculata]|uniref:Rhodopsin domain-containing protein n=1 Tax=Podospora appendiculata TaxID=314037 RepID=A0AAE0X020_9PEZI|nr:hypothetical protein B0T22DRAFT_523080 [Podospora appendiculata]
MMGGKAPMAMAVMWCLTIITLIFVVLRVYTRVVIVRQLGWDDHIYALTGGFLLLYTVFLQLSANYGFGQAITALELDDAVQAVQWEMVGQTFAVIGMATAKVSLGLFLLRIVIERWQRVAIHVASSSLLAVSVMTAIIFWIQCLPPQSIFDPRVKGKCIVQVEPFSLLLGSWCAAVDFFFAAFPWIFIWGLNMRFKEKVTIAASMSLGVIAGICGIIRTVELSGLASANYTEDTVNLIIWSAAELAVTMICAGIPLLRPLLRLRGARTTNASSSGYYRHSLGNDGASPPSFKMQVISTRSQSQSDVENSRGFPEAHPKLGIRGPMTKTYIARDNNSDEEILGPEYRQSLQECPPAAGEIQVRKDVDDVRVEQAMKQKPGDSSAG